jgi:putative ABC transport system permease protein
MNTLRQDIRFALRTLARKPAFAAVIVLTLALGIGASTAIFRVVNAVVLRPLPFREPGRLMQVYESYPKGGRYHRGSEQGFITVRPGTYHDWAEQNRSFSSMSAYYWKAVMLTGGDNAEVAAGHEVTPNSSRRSACPRRSSGSSSPKITATAAP